MSIWRIQTNTSSGDIARYCIENRVIAMGWSLNDHPHKQELENLSFSNYLEIAETCYTSFGSVTRLAEDLRPNDLIWLRYDGKYYLARIKETSMWLFDNSQHTHDIDACNQVNDIDWICIGDESEIPGGLSTAFIRGSTLQRIYKPGILEYSELIYDQKSTDDYRYNRTISLNQENFYSLISPSDCEDLLYVWLYSTHDKDYICIPSTNKLATEKYEFVIIDTKTGNHVYIQVKNGETNLNANDYLSLVENTNNEVYLLTTRGTVTKNKCKAIHVVDPKVLFDFAMEEENTNIIPPNIKYWIEFAGGYDISQHSKGIIFDVGNEEKQMFDKKVVSAWGTSKRYINSFKKDDIVFFYKKWYGIIAVGKIISDNPTIIPDGLEHNIEFVVSPQYYNNEFVSLRPAQIKEICKKSFYFATTRKVPFLSFEESKLLINELNNKQ